MRRWLVSIAGLALMLGLAFLVFRGTDWSMVGATLASVHLGWLVVAELLLVANHLVRVVRWRAIVVSVAPVSFFDVFRAAQIGVLVNVTVPLRAGEGARALLLAGFARISWVQSLATVSVDRAADALMVLGFTVIVLLAQPLAPEITVPAGTLGNETPIVVASSELTRAGVVVALFLALLIGAMLVLVWSQGRVVRRLQTLEHPLLLWFAQPLGRGVEAFVRGLEVLRSRQALLRTLGLSLLAWVLAASSMAAVLRAFEISASWVLPMLVLVFVALLISAPLTPGLIGQFHLAVVAALLLGVPGQELDAARAVAITSHIVSLLPVLLLGGLAALWRRGDRAEVAG